METKTILNLGLVSIYLLGVSVAHASDTMYCDADGGSREVLGKIVADCDVGDAAGSSVSVVEQKDGSLVATVSTESFGGSYPTNCYDVKDRSQDEAGAPRYYAGKGFALEIDVDSQATKKGFPSLVYAPGSVAGLKHRKISCRLD